MPSDTTIGISEQAWRRLNALKQPGDGFDDVILRLTTDDDDEIPTLGDGERGAFASSMDTTEWVPVPIDDRQQLYNGRMEIDGVGDGPANQRKAVEFCERMLTNADAFSAPVGWQTEIVPSLSVEELIGGFLAAADTSHLTDDERGGR